MCILKFYRFFKQMPVFMHQGTIEQSEPNYLLQFLSVEFV